MSWAADLHETGLCVSHSQYQHHSGYLVAHSDMPGFTRQEQGFLAALVRHHRRPVPAAFADELPSRLHEPLRITLFCLRFACILCRSRDEQAVPRFRLGGGDNMITAGFPRKWREAHPLTMFDLRQETRDLKSSACTSGLTIRIAMTGNGDTDDWRPGASRAVIEARARLLGDIRSFFATGASWRSRRRCCRPRATATPRSRACASTARPHATCAPRPNTR